MKSCSVCKTKVNDSANYCTFCGSKIQSLSDMINEKQNELFSYDKKDIEESKNLYNDTLSIEVEKIKRNSLIYMLLFMLLLLSLFLINNKNNKVITTKEEYIIHSKDPIGHIYEFTYDFNIGDKNINSQGNSNFINNNDHKTSSNKEIYTQITDSFNALNIDKNKIVSKSFKNDLEGNKIYSFSYNSHGFNALFDKQNKLKFIKNSLNENIFENGNVIKNLNEFVVPYDDMLEINKISKMIINLIHEKPIISKFPNIKKEQYAWNMTLENNNIVVKSYVDSYNKHGSNHRDTFMIILEKNNNNYKLLDVVFNGEKSNKIIY